MIPESITWHYMRQPKEGQNENLKIIKADKQKRKEVGFVDYLVSAFFWTEKIGSPFFFLQTTNSSPAERIINQND